MPAKKSKTTSRILTVSRETIEDCVSSWLTATGFISRNEFVNAVDLNVRDQKYIIEVENGQKEKEEIED